MMCLPFAFRFELRACLRLALCALIFGGGPWAGQAMAATPDSTSDTGGSLQACRAVVDAVARLACYDALPLPLLLPAVPHAGRVAPLPSPALTMPPPAAADPVASFGLPTPPAQVQEITSSIRGHFEGWSSGTRITLANGQVWEVLDTTGAYYELDNPKVTVRHGALGSFVLEIEGARRSPHVRRIL